MLDRLRELARRTLGRVRDSDDPSRATRRRVGDATDSLVVSDNTQGDLYDTDAPAGAPVNWVRPVDEGRPRK